MLDDESTPTPEETTTTPTQPEQSASTPDTSVTAADAVPPEKPAAKKAARKTQAKNAPGKKAATKKATAELPSAEGARDEAATAEAPTANKTAVKKTAPKKATAKKATAKKTTTTAKADTGATDESSTSPAADSDAPPTGTPTGVSSATAMLFQPPEQRPSPAPKRTSTKPTADAPPSPDGDASGKDTQGGETGPAQSADEDGGDEGASRRRRRRGGRRRRKSDTTEEADREPQSGASADGPDESESTAAAAKAREKRADKAAASGKAGEDGAGGTRRRRRRRRQGEEDGAAPDDPENTVTRVREPRESSDDEISGVSGSTRLEAKKQRRREGREAGRRRAPIVSEAEFLARREAVDRVMVVRQRADLTQIGVLEDDVLVEHYVARESQTSLIGNVYLGRVQNVLPSMEAAFIDIGKGRNAVLYAGEVNWGLLGKDGEPRRIETALKSGQTILVQVTKDPVAHKGARLTSQVSLPGRYLVYVPGGQTGGISRKLPDTERNRLKSLLKEILPEDAGVIIRTAAEGASEQELRRDVTRLTARWDDIEKKVAAGQAPQLLYGEPDLMIKVVRDLFTEDFQKLVVSGDDAWDMIEGYVGHVAPDLMDRVERWQKDTDGDEDVFASYRLDEQIEKALERKVWLPSGGSLVIDRTEAMTVVDVNTGKFTGSGGNLEETVTKNNLEAAEEIVRQLRLRDIGGIIVVDFIDMVLESNRDLVLRRLIECLGRDRTRHQVAEVTSLGLVQMTRKRIGTGLLEAFSEPCEHCGGRGLHTHHEPIEPKKSKHDSDDSRRGGRRTRRGEGGRSDKAGGRRATSDKGSGKPVEEAAKEPAKQADREVTEKPAKEPAPTVQPAKEAGDAVPGTAAPQPAAAVAPPAAEAASPPVASPPEQETPAAASERSPRRTRRRAATRAAGPPVPSGSTDAHPRPTEQPVGHFDPNSADSV